MSLVADDGLTLTLHEATGVGVGVLVLVGVGVLVFVGVGPEVPSTNTVSKVTMLPPLAGAPLR